MPDNVYNIQWFPGHMSKTRRMISESLSSVDVVIEIRDARIPRSSENPEIAKLVGSKPRIVVLNKSDLCDPDALPRWTEREKSRGALCVSCDSSSGKGLGAVGSAINSLCRDKLEKMKERSFNRRLKAMVVGIPNVGKSTLINRMSGENKAKVENRPGVTRDRQWVKTVYGFDLLDMPGVLLPKFDDSTTAENLAITGAIRDDILDRETLALILISRLKRLYPALLSSRYRIDPDFIAGGEPIDVFDAVAKSRGLLLRGGEPDYERASAVLLDDFRSGRTGKITLDELNDA